ncbi:hypothetical protein [Roseibium marinum]|uniref:Uncharacterized protein n=1 Tax=Roseibium marinum TaxID=281252 RepID=A0A2S3V319_9HYPH|nr:hypothetical protein [Roseibium marinum]POF34336.1 hypothetical protein CLV41_101790 [Roseibium marinum]
MAYKRGFCQPDDGEFFASSKRNDPRMSDYAHAGQSLPDVVFEAASVLVQPQAWQDIERT